MEVNLQKILNKNKITNKHFIIPLKSPVMYFVLLVCEWWKMSCYNLGHNDAVSFSQPVLLEERLVWGPCQTPVYVHNRRRHVLERDVDLLSQAKRGLHLSCILLTFLSHFLRISKENLLDDINYLCSQCCVEI